MLCLAISLLAGCDEQAPTGPNVQSLSASSSVSIAEHPAYKTMLQTQRTVYNHLSAAVGSGADIAQLKADYAAENYDAMYETIGLSPSEVSSLDQIYSQAFETLRDEYPNEVVEEARQGCAQGTDQLDLVASLVADNARTAFAANEDGCGLGGYACAIACGLPSPTLIVATLCGVSCYCGFCAEC